MEFSYFVGWDVSKDSLNYCVRDLSFQILHEGRVSNRSSAIQTLLKQLTVQLGRRQEEILHCLENTGHYGNPLLGVAQKLGLKIWQEDPFQLNRSMGRQKDKTDHLDARNIAEYCVIHRHRAVLYQPFRPLILRLRDLSKLRLKLLRTRRALQVSLQEKSAFALVDLDPCVVTIMEEQIKLLTRHIDQIGQRILTLIATEPKAQRKLDIALSVAGIGPKNVISILAVTGLFEFISSAKQCACYAGISPHARQSGSSIKKRQRVSRAASKELKTAFHQGAIFLICRPSPFKDLYDRLRAKGRTYRQAINAVRNKMIRVLYACLEKNVMYDKKMHQSFA